MSSANDRVAKLGQLGQRLNMEPFIRNSGARRTVSARNPPPSASAAAAVKTTDSSPGTNTTTSGSSPGGYTTTTTDSTPERRGIGHSAAAAASRFDLSDDSASIMSSLAGGVNVGSERNALHKALTMARQDNRALRSQIDRMRAREIEIASATAATTAQLETLSKQMEGIKRRARQELCRPVDEATYNKLVERAPSDLDLFDTMRVAVFRQIGELQMSRDNAVRELREKAERFADADDFAKKARFEMEQMQRAHQHEMSGMQDQIDVWRNRCEQNELSAKTAALTRDANESKAARFDALEAELRRATSAASNAEEERARLKQRVTHTTEELAQLRGELQREQLLLHNTQTELKFSVQKGDMLAARVRDLEDSLRRATAELDDMRANKTASGTAIGAERESLRASYEEQLKAVQERHDRMRQDEMALAMRAANHGAERECALLRDARDAATSELTRVRQQLAEVDAQATAAKEALQAKLLRADREIFELKIEVANKTNDCRRMDLSAQEAAAEIERLRTDSACSKKQLDVLKQEYYDMRAQYHQQVAQLQSKAEGMEGQIEMFRSLETEAEVFMQHLAESSSASPSDVAVRALMDVPSSRRAAHTISVTKRCLALENQISLLKHEHGIAEIKAQKMHEELERARAALSDSNSPYLLLEKGIAQRDEEIRRLRDRVRIGEEELSAAMRRERLHVQDIEVLTAYRAEVVKLRDALRGAAGGGGALDASAFSQLSSSKAFSAADAGARPAAGDTTTAAAAAGASQRRHQPRPQQAAAEPEDGFFEINGN